MFMKTTERFNHTFGPLYDENSTILILGSFPSVKSREQQFYYGHPQNRFWKVLSEVTGDALPLSIEEKKQFLLRNHIALWDVIESCEITGSSDSSIKNVKVNAISELLDKTNIERVFVNGGKAFELYQKYIYPQCGVSCIKLPSTSPANAAWNLKRLYEEWKQIK